MQIMKTLGLAVLAAAALAAPAGAQDTEKGGGACVLEGNVAFHTGLTMTPRDFTYSFQGTLSQCQSDRSEPPTTGTVSTGGTRTIDGVAYQEPVATGHGSCGSSTTQGVSIIDWANGGRTIVQYTTRGATALVGLHGEVIESVTLTAADGSTIDLRTTYFPLGATSIGSLVFGADGSQCNTEAGVTEATITGVSGIGDYV